MGDEVTEYTETRETTKIGERLHGVEEEEEAAHTHTHTEGARDNGGELAEHVGTRCGQLSVLPRNEGRRCTPLKPVTTRRIRSCRARLRGRVLQTGERGAWGV